MDRAVGPRPLRQTSGLHALAVHLLTSASLSFLLGQGSGIEFICLGCRRCPSVDVVALAKAHGKAITIEDIGRRAKCTVCGHLGAKLNPIPDYTRGIAMGLGHDR